MHLAVFRASLIFQLKSECLDEMPHDVHISSIKMHGKMYQDKKDLFLGQFFS